MTDSERTTMTILVVNGKFCPNSNGLEVIRYFFFAWDFTTGSELLGVLAGNDSQKVKISIKKRHLLNGHFLESIHVF